MLQSLGQVGPATTPTGAPSGKAVADDGSAYDSIQSALDAATDKVVVGGGTFYEELTITTTGLTLEGGHNTVLDASTGGTGWAVSCEAVDVTVRGLTVTANDGSGIDGNGAGKDGITIENCRVESGVTGTAIRVGPRGVVTGCVARNGGTSGSWSPCFVTTEQSRLVGNFCVDWLGRGVYGSPNTDNIIAYNAFRNPDHHGIALDGSSGDHVVVGNRVQSATGDGINTGGADHIVANNRIADSGSQDIDDGATNTTLDANVTGASN